MQTNPLALFGDHLAHLRKARGWSQEKLALESGLARSYVSGIERGRRNVALVNICVLADTLGVSTSEMLRFSQAPTGTDANALAAERTPLPQISRSLGRLENRDQVWLAEIIRSLSSRLSHAGTPASVSQLLHHGDSGRDRSLDAGYGGAYASGIPAEPSLNDAIEEDEDDEREDAFSNVGRNETGDLDAARHGDADRDDLDACDARDARDARDSRIEPPTEPRIDPRIDPRIEPRFDSRFPVPQHPTAGERFLAPGEIAQDDSHRTPAVDEE